MSRYLSAPHLYALGAIALWASLATLGVALSHLPPFLLTGLALLIGSIPAWPRWREWHIPGPTVALGLYGLFGYHFLLFVALRDAPPVEANLVNYLWPLLIVVLSPVLLPGLRLHAAHLAAAVVGFAGAALAIAGGRQLSGELSWGYLAALGSAVIWASYSLLTKRVARFPTSAIGLFGLASGLLSLLCHALLEPPVTLTLRDWILVAVMGLGPLGASFFLWDRALKDGDPRTIGILSYVTPLGSTLMLMVFTGRTFSLWIAGSAALIVGAAVVGMRAQD
ncbi:MAG TPA: DMT family transporter [Burkholderiaceae bacterium]|nr:DMT family transporter [Burkholderiaceae bacterium]